MIYKRFWTLALLIGLLLVGCTENHYQDKKPKKINFKTNVNYQNKLLKKNSETIYVAVSAMISPKETFEQYQELFSYLSKKLKKPIKLKQRKTYGEVNDLLKKGELDFALVCSGAYVVAERDFPIYLLAVPVVRGKPLYHAYIIVNKKSGINKFEQLKGKAFAYTDLLSNTGYKYALKLLKENNFKQESFFSSTIFTHAHDYSIQAVERGIVDGASVESLIFDYIKTKKPQKVKNIRIINKSDDFGIPPFVFSNKSNLKEIKKIQKLLFNMHKTEEGKKILQKLLIDKFIPGEEKLYNSVKTFN